LGIADYVHRGPSPPPHHARDHRGQAALTGIWIERRQRGGGITDFQQIVEE
jgi:hypothetical protein